MSEQSSFLELKNDSNVRCMADSDSNGSFYKGKIIEDNIQSDSKGENHNQLSLKDSNCDIDYMKGIYSIRLAQRPVVSREDYLS